MVKQETAPRPNALDSRLRRYGGRCVGEEAGGGCEEGGLAGAYGCVGWEGSEVLGSASAGGAFEVY